MEERRTDIIGPGVADEAADKAEVERIRGQVRQLLGEFFEAAGMKRGQILVVGCSSSEIESHRIGSYSSREIGQAVFEEIYQETQKRGIYLAAQCCEHLNRALIVEEECAEKYGLEQVNVVPQLKAGGSFATAAFSAFENPAAVERIQAHGHRRYVYRNASAPGSSAGPHLCEGDWKRPCDLRQNQVKMYRRRARGVQVKERFKAPGNRLSLPAERGGGRKR